MDASNGWEQIATWFIDYNPRSRIGVDAVRAWAGVLPGNGSVLDLGCGPGGLRSDVLTASGLTIYAIDAAPTLAAAYQTRYPLATVACGPAESLDYFGRQFDGILAWGLLFLLPGTSQRQVIARAATALAAGGRFLFTAPKEICEWPDASTGRLSVSLGDSAYRETVAASGLRLVAEYDDEGDNHYFDCRKPDVI